MPRVNRSRPATRVLLPLLMAAGASGCMQGGQVRIHYEILPPVAPSEAPEPPPTPTEPPPSPSPAPSPAPTPSAAALPTGEPTPSEELVGVPITARVELDAPYEIFLRLRNEAGRVVAEDRVSPDGFGVEEKLMRVPPGRYRLLLWAHPLGEARPLYDKVIELTPDYPPRFHLGLLTLDLPATGTVRYREGMTLQLLEDPSLRVVWEAPLGEAAVRTTFGDLLPDRLILPFGAYSLRLLDRDTQDDVHLVAVDGLPMSRTDPIPFQLSKATPSVLIDMSPQLRIGPVVGGGQD